MRIILSKPNKVNLKTKNSDETRQWKDNLQLILCQQDLCNVFYHNGKETLQTSILGALMNNLTKNDLVDQLHLAMKLNQVDLARDRINAAQRTISTNDAHELMVEALLQNRVAFVELLIHHSYVNISRFMTAPRLRELYHRGLEQDIEQPGDHSFFHKLVAGKIPINQEGHGEKILEEIKRSVQKEGDGDNSYLKLFDYIPYCERKLLMGNWNSIYTRERFLYSSNGSLYFIF